MSLSAISVPILMCVIVGHGLVKKVDIAGEFVKGAEEYLKTAVSILPMLILLVTAVGMFTASGAVNAITELVSPLLSRLGFPSEAVPLALVRPISGSGALASLDSLLSEVGADSFAGRTASVLMGSTETTFYTIAVYCSASQIKSGNRVYLSSLTADMASFIFAPLTVNLFYS